MKLSELVQKGDLSAKSLDKKEISTGSIVLDTVREYTKKYPLCVLLVQVGDFYELYESHATRYAPQLDLKLTRKAITANTVVDFAGFPLRSLDRYLDILVNRLQCRVALCEQLGAASRDDRSIMGMHRRITRIITPGTVIEERFLEANQYNYLLSIFPSTQDKLGLAWVDISVGEFVMQETTLDTLKDDLARIRPREVVLPESLKPSDEVLQQGLFDLDVYDPVTRLLVNDPSITVSYQMDDHFNASAGFKAFQALFTKFAETSDFGQLELGAAMALMAYVSETHVNKTIKWQMPTRFSIHDTVRIDSAAMSSLELVKTLQGRRNDSLLSILDCTCTSAGSRLLNRWISSPLTNVNEIKKRLDVVEYFSQDSFLLQDVRHLLRQSTDAQRALQRLALKRGQHSDVFEVWSTLDIIKNITGKLKNAEASALRELIESMDPHMTISQHIQDAFDYEKIQSKEIKEYGFVNHAFHPELAQLHNEITELEQQRTNLQDDLRELCGNSVTLQSDGLFRHIVEVSTRQSSHLLQRFPQAQLVSSTKSKNRYQMEAWSDISMRLSTIQSRIIEIENQVFDQVVDRLLDHSTTILHSCRILAQLDVLASFSHLALERQYVRPRVTKTSRTMIIGGRHPVVEANLAKKGISFVANDCILDRDERIWLLTGPNMGGKSTFLRQYAIIVLMAHIGCFVPADRAWIGVTDRIFSRVGAADNLAQNQSTFMVEMSELSTILKLATEKSTVIMDEVGRGTSTAEGFSLALGILDYLHNSIKCRTLYATHYHELADAVKEYEHIKCYMTNIEEDHLGRFRFVHKVQPGVCRQSHGLKVAQLAGLPAAVIDKAKAVWSQMETKS
ncbi:Putative DNA mismatch repair protein MutS [Rhizopus microsporus]|nr:Putative DNA mismatch repair protein MutS [Rhizopus microsporus]